MTHYPLCSSFSLAEGQSRGLEHQGLRLLAVRKGGRVHVYRNRCPHRGGPLEWERDRFLDATGKLIECARHGALFLIENGECVAGPCLGDALEQVPCGEDENGIWVSLPER